ncbi:MAG TPA: APC family permease [Candidatus Dormibacteraeota bacterium]|nr:APC family permease [Candidatus Dormibacteraeota bacterium]
MGSQGSSSAISGLQRDAIGLAPVLFQSITHMAPAAAVAFSIIFATTYAGGATPLAVVLALIACLFVAISIAQLARHLPSAGGLYTYSARGLHPIVGFFVAWGFMLAEPIVAPLLYLVFGNALSGYLNAHFGTPIWLWAPFAAAAGIGVWVLVYRGVRISTETGVALGAFEIVVFLALAITLIIAAGSNNTLSVFSPSTGTSSGMGSVFAGMVYTVLAFIGFEASAPLGEEAKDPKRTIPRAVILSCVLIGVFYLICYYGATVYFGPDKMADPKNGFFAFNGNDPWDGLASKVWGPLAILVLLAILNSAFANSNAGANAASRVGFALGRVGILPRALATVHPRFKTPSMAIHVQGALGLVIAIGLGFALYNTGSSGTPLNAFALLGTVATLVIVCIYILTNVANVVFYLRHQRDEFNVVWNLIVPVVGTLIFIPVLVASFGIDFGGLGIVGLTPPASAAPAVVGVWMLIGVVLYFYLASRSPAAIRETATTFIEA